MLVKKNYGFYKIMSGSDLSRRRLPFMSAVSQAPGPVVWLTACGHGDEVGGIVIIQEVFRSIRRKLIRGEVHAFPLMNPLGFETATRSISMSLEDLNRSFPGNPNGTLGERIAHSIFSTIIQSSPHLVLDFHNDWIRSIPYALIDHDPANLHQITLNTVREIVRFTGLCTILDTDVMKRSLSYNLVLKNIPAITLEMGEAYVVNETCVKYGLQVVWNILSQLEMIEPLKELFTYPLPEAYPHEQFLNYWDRPYGSRTGIIRFLVKPGEIVKTGQPLARIVNAFGKRLETIKAQKDAIVLGHTDLSATFPGKPILAFGIAPT